MPATDIAKVPLFVCHANRCRSVIAKYLYEHIHPGSCALSAGVALYEPTINDRAAAMLRHWGIDVAGHRPQRIDRNLCDRADAIFVMGPSYLQSLLSELGSDLATKAYLFADPFNMPDSFANNKYLVFDPSFDTRPTAELVQDFVWLRERVAQIRAALDFGLGTLVPASQYQAALEFLAE